MSISLFSSALPCEDGKEKRSFYNSTRLPAKGNPANFNIQYKSSILLAKLLLEVGQETADAILEHRYTKFDALIKNFGCQITALEVMQLIQQVDFKHEATQLHILTSQRLEQLGSMTKAPLGSCNMTVVEYLQSANLDVELSPIMAKMVRFRILNIVNTNALVNGNEKPVTDLQLLRGRLTELPVLYEKLLNQPKNYAQKTIPFFDAWVHGLQTEEARSAVRFIQGVSVAFASEAAIDKSRAAFLVKLLGDEFVRTAHSKSRTPIVSQPQLYTGEMSLKAIKGVVLLKNKLTLGGECIENANPIKAYVQMPEERILTHDEVQALAPHTPIVVLEGFIANDISLDEKIRQLGVVRILNGTLARLEQYASRTSQAELRDEEAANEINKLKEDNEAYAVMQMDHMYCASIEEER